MPFVTLVVIGILMWVVLHRSVYGRYLLAFGRNEEAGLRCVYHGWKFDVHGNCVDMPNEPAESDFKQKVKASAYPCIERNGVVWAYMGPRQTPPPLPDFEETLRRHGLPLYCGGSHEPRHRGPSRQA